MTTTIDDTQRTEVAAYLREEADHFADTIVALDEDDSWRIDGPSVLYYDTLRLAADLLET